MEGVGSLFQDHGAVDMLRMDDELQEHMRKRSFYDKHRVTLTEILEVHDNSPKYFLNNNRAPAIMIGETDAGRVLVVPVEPTGDYGVWRPVTAFEGNAHHKAKYRGENK